MEVTVGWMCGLDRGEKKSIQNLVGNQKMVTWKTKKEMGDNIKMDMRDKRL
jgi:hypothetical protein